MGVPFFFVIARHKVCQTFVIFYINNIYQISEKYGRER